MKYIILIVLLLTCGVAGASFVEPEITQVRKVSVPSQIVNSEVVVELELDSCGRVKEIKAVHAPCEVKGFVQGFVKNRLKFTPALIDNEPKAVVVRLPLQF